MTEVTLAAWDASILWYVVVAFVAVSVIFVVLTRDPIGIVVGMFAGVIAFAVILIGVSNPAEWSQRERVNALTENGYTMVEVNEDGFFAAGPDGQAVRGTFTQIQDDRWLIVEFK